MRSLPKIKILFLWLVINLEQQEMKLTLGQLMRIYQEEFVSTLRTPELSHFQQVVFILWFL